MTYNEAETLYYLIDPVLREKGYDDHQRLVYKCLYLK
jgi:type I restriction enzyme, R subunit